MSIEAKKVLILDYKTWRCGMNGENRLGEGGTYLLNNKGYMCCLGQFTKQLNPLITDSNINGQEEPCDIQIEVESLNRKEEDIYYFSNTLLSTKAISINDCTETTPQTKIEQLKELFGKEGYEIVVINQE